MGRVLRNGLLLILARALDRAALSRPNQRLNSSEA